MVDGKYDAYLYPWLFQIDISKVPPMQANVHFFSTRSTLFSHFYLLLPYVTLSSVVLPVSMVLQLTVKPCCSPGIFIAILVLLLVLVPVSTNAKVFNVVSIVLSYFCQSCDSSRIFVSEFRSGDKRKTPNNSTF